MSVEKSVLCTYDDMYKVKFYKHYIARYCFIAHEIVNLIGQKRYSFYNANGNQIIDSEIH